MKHKSAPIYQNIIQNLPFGNHQASRALGFLLMGRVKAVVNQANMTLDLHELIQRQMFLDKYEPTETEWFKQCVKYGDTFIDVGANFGHYTTLGALLVGATGKVFAFEPSPLASRVIEEMIIDTNLKNVLLTKAAVGESKGTVDLFLPTTKYLHSPSIMQSDASFVPIQIPVIALDTFEPLKDVEKIKLIKIDVEGYEPNVLDGMENLMKEKRIQNIFCEFNSGWLERNSTTPKQLLERFFDYGYKINMQTKLQEKISGHKGIFYDLQDIWFTLPEM